MLGGEAAGMEFPDVGTVVAGSPTFVPLVVGAVVVDGDGPVTGGAAGDGPDVAGSVESELVLGCADTVVIGGIVGLPAGGAPGGLPSAFGAVAGVSVAGEADGDFAAGGVGGSILGMAG